MLKIISSIFWLAAPNVLLTASAFGAITYSQTIVYKETTFRDGSEVFNSATAFQPGDTFQFSATFDTSQLETAPESNFWSFALSGFSLTRTGGTGAWSPTGTFNIPRVVILFGTSGLSTFGFSDNQPNLTGTSTIFRDVEVNLAGGTIFRDLTTPGRLSLGDRLGGPILPDLTASDVIFNFWSPEESPINVVFQVIPEPSSAVLLSAIGLLALRRKR
jgi:hypothetical protein